MAFETPYLFGPAGTSAEASITAIADAVTGTVEVAVAGCWSGRLRGDTYHALRTCLAEHPVTLLVDLTALDDPWAGSAPVWVSARSFAASLAPPVTMALCLPATAPLTGRLHETGTMRAVPVFAGPQQARAALAERRTLNECVHLVLPARLQAGTLVRETVAQACRDWGFPGLIAVCRLVASELVLNAVEHAGAAPVEVVVSRRDYGIHVAVVDGSPELPRLFPDPPRGAASVHDRGLGLRIVHAAALAWGALPSHRGKMVWALLSTRPTRRVSTLGLG
jgi:anti-sigma regulatory factor (Ser/Thr protein kinase)